MPGFEYTDVDILALRQQMWLPVSLITMHSPSTYWTLPWNERCGRGVHQGLQGGTVMRCTMVPKVDYLDKANIIAQQREAGLPEFQEGAPEGVMVDLKDVLGLGESDWTQGMSTFSRSAPQSAEHNFLHRLLGTSKLMLSHRHSWIRSTARLSVTYFEVIKRPMEHKSNANQYPILKSFYPADLNCRLYNPDGSVYVKHAAKLEKFTRRAGC
ncbi:hypothetical protein BU15DRAFT_66658 [Melanogaster broomeanus]|nr:hypothetical protein BU15DRAFT_66658 [Melanogaster broomeanus]